ncbi:hypothetical protein KQ246_07080 [Pseudoalteromonas shioyasakiensis]|nr:hypothetical protein KQ246_07080 [Pseudoalteromonas shioyasakiensis]
MATNIVYIGSKRVKKDTVCGTRLIFKRHEPIPVDDALAPRFLDFPTVWVKESQLQGVIERQKMLDKIAEEERLAAEEAAKKAEADANMVVTVEGEEVDLGKYSSKQLDTFVVAHELEIEGPKKPVDDYRKKVRDAFRALTSKKGGE